MIVENTIPIEQLAEKSTEARLPRTFFDLYARQWMTGTLILTDLFCLFLAIFAGLMLRHVSFVKLSPAYDQTFILLAIVLVFSFYRKGLYPGVGLHYIDELRDVVNGINFVFLIIAVVAFLQQTSLFISRLALLYIWLLSLVLIPAGRQLVRWLLIRVGLWGVPVAIIGYPGKARDLAEYFGNNLQYGIRPGLLISDGNYVEDGYSVYPVLPLSKIREATRHLSLHDALILVEDLNHLDALIDRYRFIFQNLILIKDQTGKYGLASLKPLDFSSVLGLQVKNNLLSSWSQFLKKLIDLSGSFFVLLFLAPFLGLIALLIKLDSPGRVFYRQVRLGKNGKAFSLLKFRTMHINADQILKKELERDPELKEEWDRYQKLKVDPRITRVGKILRKFSLDELPQLFNVLKGEMSLVGPRPILPDQSALYGPSFKGYIQVTPGMTGLWQVSGRNRTTFVRRAELDDEYIQRWSLWMDIFILIKTIKVVLWPDGAY